LDEPANSEALINIINWCFHPEPQKRPKAKDINEVMNGIVLEWPAFGGGAVPVKPKKTDKPTKLIVPDKPLEPSDDRVRGKLVLVSESGQRLSMNVSTNLGKNNCQAFGEEARFLDSKQMTLEKDDADGSWRIVHNSDAPNDTTLNQLAVTVTSESLKKGDVLNVGRVSNGVFKLPLTVEQG